MAHAVGEKVSTWLEVHDIHIHVPAMTCYTMNQDVLSSISNLASTLRPGSLQFTAAKAKAGLH